MTYRTVLPTLLLSLVAACSSGGDAAPSEEANVTGATTPEYDLHRSGFYRPYEAGKEVTGYVISQKNGPMTGYFFSDHCWFSFSGKLEGEAGSTSAIRATAGFGTYAAGVITLRESIQHDQLGLTAVMNFKLTERLDSCTGAASEWIYRDGVDILNMARSSKTELQSKQAYRSVATKTKLLQTGTDDQATTVMGDKITMKPGDGVLIQSADERFPGMVFVETMRFYDTAWSNNSVRAQGRMNLADLAPE